LPGGGSPLYIRSVGYEWILKEINYTTINTYFSKHCTRTSKVEVNSRFP
jgi:hypothetical protein